VFLTTLPVVERLSGSSAPRPIYQCARWIKQFHQAEYAHIGWNDHDRETAGSAVIVRYGFIAVPRIELNQLRQLLQEHGPLLATGSFSHFAQNETFLPRPDVLLMQVSTYEDAEHAIVLNGYLDGFNPRILYCDPAHPGKQFVIELSGLRGRSRTSSPLHYLNCAAFPKPCAHVVGNSLLTP
jgi:hypothetical protein